VDAIGSDAGWVDDFRLSFRPVADFPRWTASLALPVGQIGMADQPGANGLSNAMAYALGVDPRTALAGDLPLATRQADGSWRFAYSRTRRTVGTAYVVEYTDSLSADTWSTVGVAQVAQAQTPSQEHWVASVPAPPAATRQRFVRLRVDLGN
jgi:hypothetical protein